jgi:hypothetical protein
MKITESIELLAKSLVETQITCPENTPLYRIASSVVVMARAYECDSATFYATGDPVNALAGIRGLAFSVKQLATAGVRRISLGGCLSRVAFGALIAAGREMREKETFTFVDDALPMAELGRFMMAKSDRASAR